MQTIFEDDVIIVVNKPTGVETQTMLTEYHPVNRIDQRVSGLVMLAKNEIVAAQMSAKFQNDEVIKNYRAVVGAAPKEPKADLKHWITKDAKQSKANAHKEKRTDGKEARMRYELVQSSERYHLLDILLQTGRFHQIRAQLAEIGCSIVGDVKYGFKRTTPDGSIFLQAYGLSFAHPKTNQMVHCKIPMPESWAKYGFSA